jgi:hypothetical protein
MGRTALCFIRKVAFVSIFLILGALATAQAQSFTVSGRVTDPPSGTGVGIPGVSLVMTLNGSTQISAQTDSSGNFSFAAIAAGSNYDVTPSKPNFTFTPSSQGGGNIQADRTLFFTGTATTSAVVQFNAANSSASESNTGITIDVIRSGDTSGTSSVNYTTSDTAGANPCSTVNNVASSRCDYITTLGTLSFAPNETVKTISIPIIDDVYAEGPTAEAFTITLSNASGAALGTPATATLTIIDNDSVNGTSNPIDVAGFFVRQHYVDFFSREPDTSGLNFWTNEITQCGADAACTDLKRINVSAAFFLSIEFQQTGYLVHRIYKASYGDAVGTSTIGGTHDLPVPIVRLNEFLFDTQRIGRGVIVGQTGWEQVLENNKQAFCAEFVRRTRFSTAFASTLTPAQFVDALFAKAAVTPSGTERQTAIDEFGGAGTSADLAARGRALRRVAENGTLSQLEFNRAFVLMQFFGYLRRNPNDPQDTDYTGYDFWLGKLNQFGGNFVNAEMVKAFITSIEYRRRFAP